PSCGRASRRRSASLSSTFGQSMYDSCPVVRILFVEMNARTRPIDVEIELCVQFFLVAFKKQLELHRTLLGQRGISLKGNGCESGCRLHRIRMQIRLVDRIHRFHELIARHPNGTNLDVPFVSVHTWPKAALRPTGTKDRVELDSMTVSRTCGPNTATSITQLLAAANREHEVVKALLCLRSYLGYGDHLGRVLSTCDAHA